jgi:hypothetical protein
MFERIFSKTVGRLSAVLGCIALAVCMGFVGYWSLLDPGPIVTPESCQNKLGPLAASGTDAQGILRIADLWPESTTINRRICLAVAGVAASGSAQPNANAAKPVDLTLFLNGRRVSPLTFKARPTPDIQYVIYDLSVPADAVSAASALWRELLAGATEAGIKEMSVGLSRTASDNPEAEAAKTLKLRIYYVWVLALGAAATLLLSLAFCVLAKHTSLLRDNATTNAAGVPTGTYQSRANANGVMAGADDRGLHFHLVDARPVSQRDHRPGSGSARNQRSDRARGHSTEPSWTGDRHDAIVLCRYSV